jgi:ArsR family transcriptional regulator
MPTTQSKTVPLHTLFRALADPTRLRLLNLMSDQEVCVCYFTQVIGAPQPKISRHLAYLRKAGVVTARRDGKWMHYRLCPEPGSTTASILKSTMAAFETDKRMQRDTRLLTRACCGSESLVQVRGAPLPSTILAAAQR